MLLNRLKVLREEVSTANVGTVSDLGTPPKAGVPMRRITDTAVLRRGTTVYDKDGKECPKCAAKLRKERCPDCNYMGEQVGTLSDVGRRPSSPPPKTIISHDYDFQDLEVNNCPVCGGRLAKDYCVKCKDFTGGHPLDAYLDKDQ